MAVFSSSLAMTTEATFSGCFFVATCCFKSATSCRKSSISEVSVDTICFFFSTSEESISGKVGSSEETGSSERAATIGTTGKSLFLSVFSKLSVFPEKELSGFVGLFFNAY